MTKTPTEETASWDSDVLEQIWREPMVLAYKALLFMAMADLADQDGKASMQQVCDYFSTFYKDRKRRGKVEDNPKRFPAANLPSDRSDSEWERVIREEPLHRIKNGIISERNWNIAWDPARWQSWSEGLRKAIRNTAETRLIEYFDKYVPGGY